MPVMWFDFKFVLSFTIKFIPTYPSILIFFCLFDNCHFFEILEGQSWEPQTHNRSLREFFWNNFQTKFSLFNLVFWNLRFRIFFFFLKIGIIINIIWYIYGGEFGFIKFRPIYGFYEILYGEHCVWNFFGLILSFRRYWKVLGFCD